MYVATIDNEKGKTPVYKVTSPELMLEVIKIEFFKDKAVLTTPDGKTNLEYGEEMSEGSENNLNLDKRFGIKIANLNTSPRFVEKIGKLKKLFKNQPDEVSIQ